jgi:hypothetical protein
MTKKQQRRWDALMPRGEPKYVRCYDNGGRTFDRYTVLYVGKIPGNLPGWTQYVGMSAGPFYPQGFGQHGEIQGPRPDAPKGWPPAIGRKCHLGTRIEFADLPPDCRNLVIADYVEMHKLEAQ